MGFPSQVAARVLILAGGWRVAARVSPLTGLGRVLPGLDTWHCLPGLRTWQACPSSWPGLACCRLIKTAFSVWQLVSIPPAASKRYNRVFFHYIALSKNACIFRLEKHFISEKVLTNSDISDILYTNSDKTEFKKKRWRDSK